MRDIFIDADIACKIHKPLDGYEQFVEWLLYNGEDKSKNAFLVVSNKILKDWFGRPGSSTATKNSIAAIYEQLNREYRLNKITNKDLDNFCKQHITPNNIWRKLTCKRKGSEDPFHFMAIYLSNRKMALTEDINLTNDLMTIKIPKIDIDIKVASTPNELDYKSE